MAREASFSPLASLVLLLFHISIASAAAVHLRMPLAPRQSPAATTDAPPPPPASPVSASCVDYERVASLSTIALNATLRGAFLRSSSLGTFPAAAILDAEPPKLMSLMLDAALNKECGNLTAAAPAEADRNLTAGIIAGMKVLPAPGIDPGNVLLPVLCILFIFMMGLPAMSV
ncbi:hypothetical protein F4777DRAFT_573957 [Nemania sp. FL0916]|nr:hypothetical protein F4777DRAFT_573957 [Nemania sp. FL0916]